MSVHIRTILRFDTEDDNFRNYRCENLESFLDKYVYFLTKDTTQANFFNTGMESQIRSWNGLLLWAPEYVI
jgi:hypothetical protein